MQVTKTVKETRDLIKNWKNDTKWQGYNRFMETNFRRTSV